MAIAAGKLLYDAIAEESPAKTPSWSPAAPIPLQQNFARLDAELEREKARKIAVVGQPGAGKSTFLKKLSNGRAWPPPVIGQQTDATDWSRDTTVSLISRWDGHTVVDAPGYDTASHPVESYLDSFPFHRFDVTLIFIRTKLFAADQKIFARLKEVGQPTVVVRSFCDGLDQHDDEAIAADLVKRLPGLDRRSLIFLSNRTGRGLHEISRLILAPVQLGQWRSEDERGRR